MLIVSVSASGASSVTSTTMVSVVESTAPIGMSLAGDGKDKSVDHWNLSEMPDSEMSLRLKVKIRFPADCDIVGSSAAELDPGLAGFGSPPSKNSRPFLKP